MQVSRLTYLLIVLIFFSCKEKKVEETVYDNVIYELDTLRLYNTGAEKTKQKSTEQYVSIMYTDLFSSGISSNELSELNELSLAIGDKTMVNELLLAHYLNSSSVNLPSNTQMRADIEFFVEQTYLKFYQRYPSKYESLYMVKLIEDDAELTPKDIYTAFVLSNEYYFY